MVERVCNLCRVSCSAPYKSTMCTPSSLFAPGTWRRYRGWIENSSPSPKRRTNTAPDSRLKITHTAPEGRRASAPSRQRARNMASVETLDASRAAPAILDHEVDLGLGEGGTQGL